MEQQTEFRSCGGMGCSPAALAAAWVKGGGAMPAWLKDGNTGVVLTHQGRTAVGLLCSLLGLKSGDEVILPAYNCGAEIDPFRQAGCVLNFYRIDAQANIDVADIKGRISKATKVIYVTHFYGWPQELGELAEICEERGIILVEDCAQSLFSESEKTGIGARGHFVIYSFVKFLPVPDGGALVANTNQYMLEEQTGRVPFKGTIKLCLPLLKKWFMQTNRFWQGRDWSRRLLNKSYGLQANRPASCGRPAMLPSNYFNEKERRWAISRPSLGMVRSVNVSEVVSRRRENFSRLAKRLDNAERLRPLHRNLPAGVCPFAFPVFAADPRYARNYFESRGIAVQGWPGYYPGVDWDEYPGTCQLKDALLGLPIHQFLDEAQIDYIAECANQMEGAEFSRGAAVVSDAAVTLR